MDQKYSEFTKFRESDESNLKLSLKIPSAIFHCFLLKPPQPATGLFLTLDVVDIFTDLGGPPWGWVDAHVISSLKHRECVYNPFFAFVSNCLWKYNATI